MDSKKTNSGDFTRTLSDEGLTSLQQSTLFNRCLLPDIQNGQVFPAIRNNVVDFYHEGGKLFGFEKLPGTERYGFTTHVKYASVIEGPSDYYIPESRLGKDSRLIQDFVAGYDRIKENCQLYSGVEGRGVSKVCQRLNYFVRTEGIVALDVEVSLKTLNDTDPKLTEAGKQGQRRQDRIDLLLFDTDACMLHFVEAKHYSNPEIWSKKSTSPRVVSQLLRYREQISAKRSEITKQYGIYVELINELFGLNLAIPTTVAPEPILLVFGFDMLQAAKLKELLLEDGSLEGFKYTFIGAPKNSENILKRAQTGTPGPRPSRWCTKDFASCDILRFC